MQRLKQLPSKPLLPNLRVFVSFLFTFHLPSPFTSILPLQGGCAFGRFNLGLSFVRRGQFRLMHPFCLLLLATLGGFLLQECHGLGDAIANGSV